MEFKTVFDKGIFYGIISNIKLIKSKIKLLVLNFYNKLCTELIYNGYNSVIIYSYMASNIC